MQGLAISHRLDQRSRLGHLEHRQSHEIGAEDRGETLPERIALDFGGGGGRGHRQGGELGQPPRGLRHRRSGLDQERGARLVRSGAGRHHGNGRRDAEPGQASATPCGPHR